MPWGQCKYSISSNNPGTSADNASVYGYLGNAYLLRGDTEVARRCYLEACLVNPAGVDWGHVKDEALLSLRAALRNEYPEAGTEGDGILTGTVCGLPPGNQAA